MMKLLAAIVCATWVAGCATPPLTLGYRQMTMGGQRVHVWYPTSAVEAPYQYTPEFGSTLAVNGAPMAGQWPVVVFSHGFGGCGWQSAVQTEAVARWGYVVAAPDHSDNSCGGPVVLTDRVADVLRAAAGVRADPALKPVVTSATAGMGHSVGGDAIMVTPGLMTRVVFSPWPMPPNPHSGPIQYQGAQGDLFVTPNLPPAYAAAVPPKAYVELYGGTHFEWTILACAGTPTVRTCAEQRPNVQLTAVYAVAYFEAFVKGNVGPWNGLTGTGLKTFWRS